MQCELWSNLQINYNKCVHHINRTTIIYNSFIKETKNIQWKEIWNIILCKLWIDLALLQTIMSSRDCIFHQTKCSKTSVLYFYRMDQCWWQNAEWFWSLQIIKGGVCDNWYSAWLQKELLVQCFWIDCDSSIAWNIAYGKKMKHIKLRYFYSYIIRRIAVTICGLPFLF